MGIIRLSSKIQKVLTGNRMVILAKQRDKTEVRVEQFKSLRGFPSTSSIKLTYRLIEPMGPLGLQDSSFK